MKALARVVLVIVAAFAAFEAVAEDQAAQIRPFDEAVEDAAFLSFRSAFVRAVETGDEAFLRRHLHPKLTLDFPQKSGAEAFIAAVKGDSAFRRRFLDTLKEGGGFSEEGWFEAPWTAAAKLEGRKLYDTGIITGAGVNIRAQPSLDGKIVGKASYAVVTVTDWYVGVDWDSENPRPEKARWARIRVPNVGEGYVHKDYLSSPVDSNAIFVKEDGVWLLRSFRSID